MAGIAMVVTAILPPEIPLVFPRSVVLRRAKNFLVIDVYRYACLRSTSVSSEESPIGSRGRRSILESGDHEVIFNAIPTPPSFPTLPEHLELSTVYCISGENRFEDVIQAGQEFPPSKLTSS